MQSSKFIRTLQFETASLARTEGMTSVHISGTESPHHEATANEASEPETSSDTLGGVVKFEGDLAGKTTPI